MPQFGIYDPTNSENTSGLFVFQEVPVTSTKINRWNGNIEANLQLLHQVISLIVAPSQDAILSVDDDRSLQVTAASPEDMTVRVDSGWAVIQNTLAGIDQSALLPLGGQFSAPVSNPRVDLIILRNTGALDIITGVEAASPVVPATPANSIALAQVYLRTGSTKIYNTDQSTDAYITDVRPALVLGDAHKHNTDMSPAESPDGVRLGFSTLDVFRSGTLDVYVNGILQKAGSDFNEDAGQTGYTFLSPPLSHYSMQHRYIIQHQL